MAANEHLRTEDSPEGLVALSAIAFADHSMEDVLTRATEIAKRQIPGADEVSITVILNGSPGTVAFSGRLAMDVDERQYESDTGPCLDAIRLGEVVAVPELETDNRWPAYAPGAMAAGVRSSLSTPIQVDHRYVGAVNAYGLEPRAFDEKSGDAARTFAGYASTLITNAELYFTATTRADQMVQAMESRAVIEQAKGILMAARRCNADEAFAVLVRLSQQSHRKLRDVAQALVDEAASG